MNFRHFLKKQRFFGQYWTIQITVQYSGNRKDRKLCVLQVQDATAIQLQMYYTFII